MVSLFYHDLKPLLKTGGILPTKGENLKQGP